MRLDYANDDLISKQWSYSMSNDRLLNMTYPFFLPCDDYSNFTIFVWRLIYEDGVPLLFFFSFFFFYHVTKSIKYFLGYYYYLGRLALR